jgi:hypothetical protein
MNFRDKLDVDVYLVRNSRPLRTIGNTRIHVLVPIRASSGLDVSRSSQMYQILKGAHKPRGTLLSLELGFVPRGCMESHSHDEADDPSLNDAMLGCI